MSRRIFVQVTRGMTDKTVVCIFPWEKPLLELVHGGGVDEVTIDQMCEMGKPMAVERQKLNHTENYAPDLRGQLEQMTLIPPSEDPVLDPAAEYNRLAEKYGLDKEFPVPCVERIYGQFGSGAFAARVQEVHNAALAAERAEGTLGKVRKAGGTKDPETMSVAELRDKLSMAGVRFDPTLVKAELVQLFRDTLGVAKAA